MSNEIWHSYDSAKVLYAFVIRASDDYIWDVGDTAFEAIGTWNDARADECDIPMTVTAGDYHSVDFPAGITTVGVYRVQIREKAGASPDTDDKPVAQGEIYWSGTAEQTIQTIVITNTTVVNQYDESSPPPVSVINESYL